MISVTNSTSILPLLVLTPTSPPLWLLLARAVDTLDILVTAPATCRTTGPDTLPTDIWPDTDTEPDMELDTAVVTEPELDTAPDMEPVTLLDMDPDTELATVLEPDMED